MTANVEHSAVATGLEKVSFHSNSKERKCKECPTYHTTALISPASKAMLKILQASLQQYMNRELPNVQAGFRKGRGTRDQIANILWIIEKEESSKKHFSFCFIDYAKAFDCVDHSKLENSERDGKTRPHDLPLEKSVCRSGNNRPSWTWNNRLVQVRKNSASAVYRHPAYLTSMQSTS